MMLTPLAAAATISSAIVAGPTTYIETFDDGINHTEWTWDRTTFGSVELTGGNPDGFFQSILTGAPALFNSNAMFTGDFRARKVGSIGGDLATKQFTTPAGVISIALGYHNGTDTPFDDTYAYYVSNIPSPTNESFGWVSFDFAIPFDSLTTPDGWQLGGVLPQIPPSADWNTVITHVDEIIISWNDPSQPVLLFDVVRGADNLRITYNVPGPGAAALLLGVGAVARRRRRG